MRLGFGLVALLGAALGIAQTRLWSPPGGYVTREARWQGSEVRFGGKFANYGERFSPPKDWDRFGGFRFELENRADREVELGFRVEAEGTHSTGFFTLKPGEQITVFVDREMADPALRRPVPRFAGPYRHVHLERPLSLRRITNWQLYYRSDFPGTLRVGPLFGVDRMGSDLRAVDRYGQVSARNWSEKVTRDEQLRVADPVWNPLVPPVGSGGRWSVRSAEGSAPARVVFPGGSSPFLFGVTSVAHGSESEVNRTFFTPANRTGQEPDLITAVPGVNFYASNLRRKFVGDWKSQWETQTARRLAGWGVQVLGSGSDLGLARRYRIPFQVTLTTYDFPNRLRDVSHRDVGTFPDVFHPDFQSWFVRKWSGQITGWNQTPELFMGVFVDGENDWGARAGSRAEKYRIPVALLASAQKSSSRAEFARQLVARYGTVDRWQRAWKRPGANWIDQPLILSEEDLRNPRIEDDLSYFLYVFARKYYGSIQGALRQSGCRALFLGQKEFWPRTPDIVLKAAAELCDVVSVNYYGAPGSFPVLELDRLSKPYLISEFSFAATDQNGGTQTLSPAVDFPTQQARAEALRATLQSLKRSRFCVGAIWFTWVDQPPTGRVPDGENYPYGLVRITDQPYMPMVEILRRELSPSKF